MQKPTRLRETASQTAGPYVHLGLMPTWAGNAGAYEKELGLSPITDAARGERIEISGSIADGTGWMLRDALLESWQADADGRHPGQPGADPGVSGFCRFAVDPDTGEFTLRTVKPGPTRLPDGRVLSPHVALWIVGRGINTGLATRIYFDDADRARDPVLSRIEQRHRVETLIARPDGPGRYRFDIRLQGEGETVFLDI
ncbi:protocatechuate 3,4-dioxygenase subunit alpha [Halovulum dunhuangense]|uniref:Protocatechuate 3,4-dioxygenase subunit alpha n=1 Tax=Halovulum dunhuangense TaxID=1505036 RepID=A0A849L1K2_9RHOB|nr:protocatechuate 3,4-dioxygenase subunit alpha [Halovulum dunhuangense]